MYNIHQTHFLIEKHLEQRLTETGNISFSQFLVLIPLRYREHASQTDIASALFLTDATVSRHMSTLTEEGLLTRKEDPENRRKHILTLTAKGIKAFTEAQTVIEQVLEDAFQGVPLKDRAVVNSAFDQITRHLLTKVSS